MNPVSSVQPEAILLDWFGTVGEDGNVDPARRARWWRPDAAEDARLRAAYGETLAQAATGALDAWAATPRGALALIVLLDQCSRQIHRGSAEAFATDGRALALAAKGVEAGMDRALRPIERAFFYMPFMHAEDLAAQTRGVALFEALEVEAPPALRDVAREFACYARAHRDVIARFGRFPHRNATLGRTSTPEETVFLQQPGPSF
jgi:uncharacterized protein (DUF924 family)